MHAWQSLPSFRSDATFASWLYRIVVNKSRDVQRHTRTAQEPVDLQDDGLQHRLPATPDSAQVVEADRTTEALRDAIAGLPFDLRAPLVLCEFERCSYMEAAAVLGLSEPTVRGRLVRARRELVAQMRGWS